jgi:hypothetical protein
MRLGETFMWPQLSQFSPYWAMQLWVLRPQIDDTLLWGMYKLIDMFKK